MLFTCVGSCQVSFSVLVMTESLMPTLAQFVMTVNQNQAPEHPFMIKQHSATIKETEMINLCHGFSNHYLKPHSDTQ